MRTAINFHSLTFFLIVQPDPAIKTACDIIRYAANKYKESSCVGTRGIRNIHKEMKTIKKIIDGQNVKEEKEWFYFESSPYRYLTFLEFQQIIHSIGCGLKSVGLKKDEKIHLYGATRYTSRQHYVDTGSDLTSK